MVSWAVAVYHIARFPFEAVPFCRKEECTMKKLYSPMSVDVVRFEAEDVITVSRLSVDPTTPTTAPTGDPYVTTG